MKKCQKLFALVFALMFVVVVKVNAKDMTASELRASAVDGTITLTEDVTLTSGLTVPNEITVFDLGGKTLTLNKGIIVNSTLEIKNGTVVRDSSFKPGTMLTVDGQNANLTLNDITIDGKNVQVDSGYAIYVYNNASLNVINSFLQNNSAKSYISTILASGAKNVVFDGSTITNNVNGGAHAVGIFENVQKVELKNTKITNNISETSTATVRIINCGEFIFDKDSVVSGNKATEGAGLHIQNTNSIIAGTIEGNEATDVETGNGGGLYIALSDDTKTVTIEETAVIKNNIAGGAGAGVYITGPKANTVTGNVIMNGGLITGNTSKGTISETKGNVDTLKDTGGAGIYVARGTMVINDGTIENNTSVSGVGDAILVSHAGGNTEAGQLQIYDGYVDGEVVLAETYGGIEVYGGEYTDDVTDYLNGLVKLEKQSDGTFIAKEYGDIMVANDIENGTIDVVNEAFVGDEVTIEINPKDGYKLSKLTVSLDPFNPESYLLEVTNNTFEMPNSPVYIDAEFEELTEEEKEELIEEVNTDEKTDSSEGILGETEVEPEEEIKTPNTVDNIMIYIAFGLIALVGFVVATKKFKKNIN